MAVTVQRESVEPTRGLCQHCRSPVLVAIIDGLTILAEPYEWEPRARCYVCSMVRTRGQGFRANCHRCGGTGYVGSRRPLGRMLAIDVAWSDDVHLRVVGPSAKRRRGEALMPLHVC